MPTHTLAFTLMLACLLFAAASVMGDNVYVVNASDPRAADDGPGSAEHPFKTISAAVSHLKPGDRIVIHGGVYRESVNIQIRATADKPIVITAAEGERVVVSGADVVRGWAMIDDPKRRPIWAVKPWNLWPADLSDIRRQGPQLIFDHLILPRVDSPDRLFSGSYCYDPAGEGRLLLWPPAPRKQIVTDEKTQWWDSPANLASDDPNDHLVEASVRDRNIVVADSAYLTLRGLVVRHNTAPAQSAGLHVGPGEQLCDHVIVEDCTAEFCHGRGINTSGTHLVMRRCVMRFNGALGGGGSMSDSLWEDNELIANNTLGHSHGWEAGGVKFTRTLRLTVRRCKFIGNDGPGLWFDYGNSDNIVEQCLLADNIGGGLMLEISPIWSSLAPDAQPIIEAKAAARSQLPPDTIAGSNIVRNNLILHNRWDGTLGAGIVMQLASRTIVVNNTIVGNERYGVFVRYHPYDARGYRCADNDIFNNIVADNGGGQIEITPDPVDKPGLVTRNRSDFNLLFDNATWRSVNPSNCQPNYGEDRDRYARWGKTQGNGTYSLEEWTKIRGFDAHSIQADPMFVSPASLDYRLRLGSPAIGAGAPNAYVKDDYFGQPRPADRACSIGACESTGN